MLSLPFDPLLLYISFFGRSIHFPALLILNTRTWKDGGEVGKIGAVGSLGAKFVSSILHGYSNYFIMEYLFLPVMLTCSPKKVLVALVIYS